MNILARIPAREWQGLEPSFIPGGKFLMRATCHDCGGHQDWKSERVFEPTAAVKRARSAGWNIGKRTECPQCKRKVKPMTAQANSIKAPAAVSSGTKPEPTDAMKKAKRQIFAALEDYYDDANRRYRDAHTDKSVAEELGTSEAYVKAIREADFGPLREPDEVAAMRAEIGAIASEIGKLTTRFNGMCIKQGWRV